eukprot:scaffold5034_cov385-Prasinococcus_capsulatus_cf.AAC.11
MGIAAAAGKPSFTRRFVVALAQLLGCHLMRSQAGLGSAASLREQVAACGNGRCSRWSKDEHSRLRDR